jgi:hypothetical protein
METIAGAITAALAGGAAAALKDVASIAVKDIYGALKRLISDRYKRGGVVAALEEDPGSKAQQTAVTEALEKTNASRDAEVVALADQLLSALRNLPAASSTALGLDIERFRAAEVRLRDVVASGTAVRIRDTEIAGRFDVSGVRGGNSKK